MLYSPAPAPLTAHARPPSRPRQAQQRKGRSVGSAGSAMGFVTKVLYFSLVMLALTYGEMLLHAYKHDLLGKLMDETPFWTQDMIASRLDALGENGRQAYRDFYTGLTLKGDMALPIWYSTAMTILLYRGGSGFWMFPIIAGMFDGALNCVRCATHSTHSTHSTPALATQVPTHPSILPSPQSSRTP